MSIRSSCKALIVLSASLLANSLAAQSISPLATSVDQVAAPTLSGVLGQRDGAALAELAQYFAATHSRSLIGIKGSGKITYASEDASYDATLYLLGGHKSRLDVTTDKGTSSIRLDRMLGTIHDGNGHASSLSIETAMNGIFPLDLLRTVHASDKTLSLIDRGIATIGGVPSHRITLEQLALGIDPATKQPNKVAIDFYFDTNSHLLTMTAAYITLPESKQVRLLSIVSYSDYRQVGSAQFPFRFTESLQGNAYRTLQLSSVTQDASLTPALFTF